jgi:hypothetical protein
MLKEAATERKLTEISTIIERANGRLPSKEWDRDIWEGKKPCWEMITCPPELSLKCPAHKYRSFYCWEIEGTYNKLYDDGMKGDYIHICESCRVYKKWGQGKPIQIKLFGKGFNINSLIADLSSKDGLVRKCARLCLVARGKRAVPYLIEALSEPDWQVQWEAANALGKICDPRAVHVLVRSSENKVFEVRWLACEGLIALRREALVPLLEALIKCSDSPRLRESAHHVLHDWLIFDVGKYPDFPWLRYDAGSVPHDWLTKEAREVLRQVLIALEDIDATIEAPLAARIALNALTRTTRQQANSIA